MAYTKKVNLGKCVLVNPGGRLILPTGPVIPCIRLSFLAFENHAQRVLGVSNSIPVSGLLEPTLFGQFSPGGVHNWEFSQISEISIVMLQSK